jgi:hypothetical protein
MSHGWKAIDAAGGHERFLADDVPTSTGLR